MQRLTVSEEVWQALLALRSGAPSAAARAHFDEDPAWKLYARIARRANSSFVVAQVGQSLDGRVATPEGDARDISGPDGIAHLHRLRALCDAVVVGVGTVEADDPRLTVRRVSGPCPVRVVIDPNGRMSDGVGLLCDGGPSPIVIQDEQYPAREHCETIRLPRSEGGFSARSIREALGARGLHNILIEGGALTIRNFLAERQVDRLHIAVAPLIVGSGPCGLDLPPVARLSEALRPPTDRYDLGSDVLFDLELGAS